MLAKDLAGLFKQLSQLLPVAIRERLIAFDQQLHLVRGRVGRISRRQPSGKQLGRVAEDRQPLTDIMEPARRRPGLKRLTVRVVEPEPAMLSVRSRRGSELDLGSPCALPNNAAYLKFVVAEKTLDPAFLGLGMFGMNPPFAQSFF